MAPTINHTAPTQCSAMLNQNRAERLMVETRKEMVPVDNPFRTLQTQNIPSSKQMNLSSQLKPPALWDTTCALNPRYMIFPNEEPFYSIGAAQL